MKKFSLILLAVLLGLHMPIQLVEAEKWVEVEIFSGGGSSFGTSPPFMINYTEWRIQWEYSSLFGWDWDKDFSFYVSPCDGGKQIASITSPDEKNGTLDIFNYTGEFQLFFPPCGSNWTVIIEQNLDSPESKCSWIEVDKFTGENGTEETTRPFLINYDEWRIRWDYNPVMEDDIEAPSLFQLDVIEFRAKTVEYDHGDNKQNGTLYFFKQGEFYLSIKGFNISNYTLIVEQNVESIPDPDSNWVELVGYSGSGSSFSSTPSFRIKFDEWRIKWEYTPLSPVGNQTNFDFWVIPEEERFEGEFDPTTSITGVYNPLAQKGTIYFSDMTGAFFLYFTIESSEWTVIVEQNIDSIPEFSSGIILALFLVVTCSVVMFKKRVFIDCS